MTQRLISEAWKDFGPFEGHVWLNCAHQGALPKIAAAELIEALGWKVAPHHAELNREIHGTLKQAKVDVAYRRGNLRLSPHLYNTADDIERAVSILNSVS
jgi:selenocysteine lyase/cysteine desulfurase